MRGKPAPVRTTTPDPRYKSELLGKFINCVMERGKKSVARGLVYDAFELIKSKSEKDPLPVFEAAVKNVMPVVEVKSRRVGGANYQVPIEVYPRRRQALAFRWIINACAGKKGRPMAAKLAEELLLASENQGDAIKKKMDVHRMAEANRAFAHFA